MLDNERLENKTEMKMLRWIQGGYKALAWNTTYIR